VGRPSDDTGEHYPYAVAAISAKEAEYLYNLHIMLLCYYVLTSICYFVIVVMSRTN